MFLAGIPRRPDGRVVGLSYKRLRRHLKAVATSLGWPTFSAHKCRHSFASHAAMAGVPLSVLQKWLGHSTLRMVEVYAHVSDAHSQAAMQALPGLPHRQQPATLPIAVALSEWAKQDSNLRPPACKAGALDQLSYSPGRSRRMRMAAGKSTT